MNLKTIFSYLTNNLDKLGYGILVVALGTVFTMWQLEKSGRENDRIESGNILAEHDRLTVVYKDSLGTVSGRYVFLQRKIEDTVQTLNAYIKKTKSEVLNLATINTELRLENQTLQGKVKRDSVGEFASFDTSTAYYSLGLDVRLHPKAELTLRTLVVPDNTTMAYLLQGSTIQGVITHSNPLIHDIGGSFQYKLPQTQIEDNSDYFKYIIGGTAGILAGYLIRSVTHK